MMIYWWTQWKERTVPELDTISLLTTVPTPHIILVSSTVKCSNLKGSQYFASSLNIPPSTSSFTYHSHTPPLPCSLTQPTQEVLCKHQVRPVRAYTGLRTFPNMTAHRSCNWPLRSIMLCHGKKRQESHSPHTWEKLIFHLALVGKWDSRGDKGKVSSSSLSSGPVTLRYNDKAQSQFNNNSHQL